MRRRIRHLVTGVLACAGIAFATLACAQPSTRLPPGEPSTGPPLGELAPTPPMGWGPWNAFGCATDENLIKQNADAMITSGMRDAGYEYVFVNDCWAASERDPDTGRLVAHPERFPSGIAALADHMHARGLKLGIYSSAGTRSCADSMPGSLDHEAVDARTFADWGVDLLTYDNCNTQDRPARERYEAMADALRAVDQPIVYAVHEWGVNQPWTWAPEIGAHLWATTGARSQAWDGVVTRLDRQVGLEKHAQPHGWNDPAGLVVGNGKLTESENRAHFALWALLNAPLVSGNDLRSMDEVTKEVLLNDDLIEVNQDWGGIQGHKVRDDGATEVWAKPMSDGSVAVVLLNRDTRPARIDTTAVELGLPPDDHYRTRDLWTKREAVSVGVLSTEVPPHGASVYRMWRG